MMSIHGIKNEQRSTRSTLNTVQMKSLCEVLKLNRNSLKKIK